MPKPSTVATITFSKKGPNGRPSAQILVDEGTPLKNIRAAEDLIYRDLIRKVGLKIHEGCRSGLDLSIVERFDDIVNVDMVNAKILG